MLMYLRLAALAAFIAVAGLATVFYYRGNAAIAEARQAIVDRDKALDANKEAVRTIDALQEQARQDSRLTASVLEEMRKINDGLTALTADQTDLENTNANVHTFLDAAVPGELRQLYHH